MLDLGGWTMMRTRLTLGAAACCLALAGCAKDDGDDGAGSTTALTLGDSTGSADEGEDSGEASDGGDASSAGESADGSSGADGSTGAGDASAGDASSSEGGGAMLDPPEGQCSAGSGGGGANGDMRMTQDGIAYRIIAPGEGPCQSLMIVYSGTEGGQTMTSNLLQVGSYSGADVFAVLDGTQYYGNGDAGASVLDDVRASYDIDNDRTYLLSESAGTSAGLELGLALRQSYFAAFWANDVNASATPVLTADELGFAPWGNAGPGGAYAHANAIVDGMAAAGYRIEEPAPYDGPGAGQHGDPNQFVAALSWFPGRTRQ
jgi:hypothetical protein